MAQSGPNSHAVKKRLEGANESLRSIYLDIVESLSLTELKRFDKYKCKSLSCPKC